MRGRRPDFGPIAVELELLMTLLVKSRHKLPALSIRNDRGRLIPEIAC
jgi:hypothetical protein